MSTHDPILALMADKRIVIKNGGIDKIINTSKDELAILNKLSFVDDILQDMRNKLRKGKILDFDINFLNSILI